MSEDGIRILIIASSYGKARFDNSDFSAKVKIKMIKKLNKPKKKKKERKKCSEMSTCTIGLDEQKGSALTLAYILGAQKNR